MPSLEKYGAFERKWNEQLEIYIPSLRTVFTTKKKLEGK
jgi:hypothetical protein